MLYNDNITELNSNSYTGGKICDTVMVLKETYNTPKMILFEAPDKERVMYYFIKKPGDPVPVQLAVGYEASKAHMRITGHLIADSVVNTDRGVGIIREQRFYVDQIRFAMADCDKITEDDLNMLTYRGYSFKKIIKRYNKCK
jgi:hypothetical protein